MKEIMKIKELTKIVSLKSPSILTAVAVCGLVGTTVLAVKGAFRASEILEGKKGLSFREVVKTTWKCYAPAAIVGATTAATMVWSNSIALKRLADMAGDYALEHAAFKDYRKNVSKRLGFDEVKSVSEDVENTNSVVFTDSNEVTFYDEYSARTFTASLNQVWESCNRLCSEYLGGGFASLNALYDDLGLERTKFGDLYGWNVGDGEIISPCFSETRMSEDNKPCVVLGFETEPTRNHYL